MKEASEKQLEILQAIADVTLADTLMYAEIKDQSNREQAMQIIRDLQFIRYNYLKPEVGLTADKATELVAQATDGLKELNYLLEVEGMDQLKPFEPVPMFNWLEDLEDEK